MIVQTFLVIHSTKGGFETALNAQLRDIHNEPRWMAGERPEIEIQYVGKDHGYYSALVIVRDRA